MSVTDHKIVPSDAQLASDYPSVSSLNPPAKKALDMHAVSNCLTFPFFFFKLFQQSRDISLPE